VAVLEGQLHAEVPFQPAADRVGGQGPQQLPPFSLAGRWRGVVREIRWAALQIGHDPADHLPCVGQRAADTRDELGVGDVAVLGALQQVGGASSDMVRPPAVSGSAR
jgi:hypothetical protein